MYSADTSEGSQPLARSPGTVLMVITSLDYGGAETQVVALATALKSRGWQVHVFTLIEPVAFQERLSHAGISLTSLGMRRGVADARALFRLAKAYRELRPTVVHSHMVHANLLARLARLVTPVPFLVSTVHSVVEGGRAREVAYRLTDAMADLTTNVSTAGVERYNRIGATFASKSRFVPNGVDLTYFEHDPAKREELRRELGLGAEFTWLAVGRLTEAKDYPNMLRAFAATEGRSVLLLAGDGELREQVEGLIAELGLGDRVRMLGIRTDIGALMSAADAYLLSSAWEGLPSVLLEAATAGLPLVATDVGGVSQIVSEATGLLVPPQDAEALSQAITRMQSLPPQERRQLGDVAKRKVISSFDIAHVVDTWEEVYWAGGRYADGRPRRFTRAKLPAKGSPSTASDR